MNKLLVSVLFGVCAMSGFSRDRIDINGDGRPDVCRRDNLGISCRLGKSFGFSEAYFATRNFSDAQGWNKVYYGHTIRFADVNGDGKTDVCGRSANGMLCALSEGYLFQEWTNWNDYFTNANGFAAPQFYDSMELYDFNGDGMADLCFTGTQGYQCLRSTGYSFEF